MRPIYIIEEDQTLTIFETDNKDQVLRMWNYYHKLKPDSYHEIYRYNTDKGKYQGIAQYKPGDITNPEYDYKEIC